ncbi:MAG: hypothetical protein FWE05_09520 [Defluviitaleaceae bacterium]|nr:hypothetical protein [Defluviitaleaceae bacterium]
MIEILIITFFVAYILFSIVAGVLFLLIKGDSLFSLWYRLHNTQKIEENKVAWYRFAGCKMLLMAIAMVTAFVTGYYNMMNWVMVSATVMALILAAFTITSIVLRRRFRLAKRKEAAK